MPPGSSQHRGAALRRQRAAQQLPPPAPRPHPGGSHPQHRAGRAEERRQQPWRTARWGRCPRRCDIEVTTGRWEGSTAPFRFICFVFYYYYFTFFFFSFPFVAERSSQSEVNGSEEPRRPRGSPRSPQPGRPRALPLPAPLSGAPAAEARSGAGTREGSRGPRGAPEGRGTACLSR